MDNSCVLFKNLKQNKTKNLCALSEALIKEAACLQLWKLGTH